MSKNIISDFNSFMNFKINLEDFQNTYKTYGGVCPCNKKGGTIISSTVLDMPSFINMYLPQLKGGYNRYKLNIKKKGGNTTTTDPALTDFNLFRDVLSVNTNGIQANTNILSDLTTKIFNYPNTEQTLSRSLF